MKKIKRGSVNLVVLMAIAFASFACHYAPLRERQSAAPSPVAADARAGFERDLETMRTANFDYIFVFRRKDGGVFDGEDKKYLRANAPAETNRFIATDEDRAFIAGSKYKFAPENLEVLRMRFNVEDYSTAGQGK